METDLHWLRAFGVLLLLAAGVGAVKCVGKATAEFTEFATVAEVEAVTSTAGDCGATFTECHIIFLNTATSAKKLKMGCFATSTNVTCPATSCQTCTALTGACNTIASLSTGRLSGLHKICPEVTVNATGLTPDLVNRSRVVCGGTTACKRLDYTDATGAMVWLGCGDDCAGFAAGKSGATCADCDPATTCAATPTPGSLTTTKSAGGATTTAPKSAASQLVLPAWPIVLASALVSVAQLY